jgi:hypothetical protein
MPELIRGPTQESAPSQYVLAPRQAIIPESVTATFDGSGAAGAFLPTLSIYAQSGELLARCPATSVSAGDSAEVTFAPLLRAAVAATPAGTAFPWAQSGINGFYTIASGGSHYFGLDNGNIWTTDAGIFSTELSGIPGVYGLKITGTGTYALIWTANYEDTGGAPVAAPETFVVEAQDASGSRFIMLPQIGSIYARGYTNLSGRSAWDVFWISTFAIHGGTAASDPVIVLGTQSTGVTLHVYTQLLAFQISTDTFGF